MGRNNKKVKWIQKDTHMKEAAAARKAKKKA